MQLIFTFNVSYKSMSKYLSSSCSLPLSCLQALTVKFAIQIVFHPQCMKRKVVDGLRRSQFPLLCFTAAEKKPTLLARKAYSLIPSHVREHYIPSI